MSLSPEFMYEGELQLWGNDTSPGRSRLPCLTVVLLVPIPDERSSRGKPTKPHPAQSEVHQAALISLGRIDRSFKELPDLHGRYRRRKQAGPLAREPDLDGMRRRNFSRKMAHFLGFRPSAGESRGFIIFAALGLPRLMNATVLDVF
ncbi:hypothetical protein JCM24511_04255 [Saitozyma sp. JCM 24511]|nr:hypothetical protein JCM24511_04255 [Saitozyma sp. JCM 24511]